MRLYMAAASSVSSPLDSAFTTAVTIDKTTLAGKTAISYANSSPTYANPGEDHLKRCFIDDVIQRLHTAKANTDLQNLSAALQALLPEYKQDSELFCYFAPTFSLMKQYSTATEVVAKK